MQINKQQGFTLIELVMVIVILGILAATALPKFVNLGKQARVSSVTGLSGAVNSASAIAQATYMANNNSTATTITTSDNTSVTVAASTGIPTAAGIQAMVKTGSADYAISSTSTDVTWSISTAPTPSTCQVDYVIATGIASVSSGGC